MPFAISVVIPTRAGWPAIRLSVDSLLPQLRDLGGQLIVVDASGRPVPDWATADDVCWMSMVGAPGYDLRQAGYLAADAPIVATIEDHVAADEDWVQQTLFEHETHPAAAAIYGIVENGSREKLLDWALYGVGYMPWAPPVPSSKGSPGHANLSFKRWVFGKIDLEGANLLEFRYVAAIKEAGFAVEASNRMRVTHYQSNPLRPTLELVFHSGRTVGGLRRQTMTVADWIRMAAPGLIAGYRTMRTLSLSRTKPGLTQTMVRGLPLIATLHLSHAAGESLGYLGGPGQSGTRIH